MEYRRAVFSGTMEYVSRNAASGYTRSTCATAQKVGLLQNLTQRNFNTRVFRPQHTVFGFAAAVRRVDVAAFRDGIHDPDVLHAGTQVVIDLFLQVAGESGGGLRLDGAGAVVWRQHFHNQKRRVDNRSRFRRRRDAEGNIGYPVPGTCDSQPALHHAPELAIMIE